MPSAQTIASLFRRPASAARSGRNNIDLLRLVLAFYVVYSHCRILSGRQGEFPQLNLPVDVAVQGFFVLSGYLIFKSHDASRGLADYFAKRARRIYPAYATVVLLAAVALATLSSLPPSQYFGLAWVKYVAANLVFLNFLAPTLPGVFTDSPVTPAVNAALWTIKVEVAFYLLVPLLARGLRTTPLRRALLLAGLYLASHLYFTMLHGRGVDHGAPIYDILAKQFPGQLRFFVVGAAVYYFRLERTPVLIAAGLASLATLALTTVAEESLLYPIALGCVILAFAFERIPLAIERIGDLSYGAYLFHLPIIQTLIVFGAFDPSPVKGTLITLVIVTLVAFASWHLVEKPWLRRDASGRNTPSPPGSEPSPAPSGEVHRSP